MNTAPPSHPSFSVLDLQILPPFLHLSFPLFLFIFFSALPFKTVNLLTGYSSPLNAGSKHSWQQSHRRPFTGEHHLKCWHDMEDTLGIFSFSVKLILEDDILNTFQASSRIALNTRKKKDLICLLFIFWLDGAGYSHRSQEDTGLCLAQNILTLANTCSHGQCQPHALRLYFQTKAF